MHSALRYSCLLAAVPWLSAAQRTVSDFVAIRQAYCDRGNLCVTSFDWCQLGPQYSPTGNYTTGYCNRNGTGPYGEQEVLYVDNGIVGSGMNVFLTHPYNLTWTGADPAYPVQIDLTFGPPEGPVNRTSPLWSKNVTESPFEFNFWSLLLEVNNQDPSSNVRYEGYALGWPVSFTVSQPERPFVEGINTTETTNQFAITPLARNRLIQTFEQSVEESQNPARSSIENDVESKWRLGVGVGVGVGVPLLLIAAYLLGRVGGKKASRAEVAPGKAFGKRSSDTSA